MSRRNLLSFRNCRKCFDAQVAFNMLALRAEIFAYFGFGVAENSETLRSWLPTAVEPHCVCYRRRFQVTLFPFISGKPVAGRLRASAGGRPRGDGPARAERSLTMSVRLVKGHPGIAGSRRESRERGLVVGRDGQPAVCCWRRWVCGHDASGQRSDSMKGRPRRGAAMSLAGMGCGYHCRTREFALPQNVRTIAIPRFCEPQSDVRVEQV